MEYYSVLSEYYKNVVFDLTNDDSLDKIDKWMCQLKEINRDDKFEPSLILFGNKSDLSDRRVFISLG